MVRMLRLSHQMPSKFHMRSPRTCIPLLSSGCGLLSMEVFEMGTLATLPLDVLLPFMLYCSDVSSGLAKTKLLLRVCNHIENMKPFTLDAFGG